MASMADGPVGVTYTVPATNAQEATENAWRAAEAKGRELGRTLHAEQVEAGTWDVTLQDNGKAGAGIPFPAAGLVERMLGWVAISRNLTPGTDAQQTAESASMLLEEAAARIRVLSRALLNMGDVPDES